MNFAGAGAGESAPAERIDAARVSASVFGTLGVAPIRGRVFRGDEDLPGSAPVVILGERLWKERYASDSAIVGRTVNIDGLKREIVGVMPERFTFPDDHTALWLPIGIDPAKTESATFDFRAVARLRPGVTVGAATADLDALLPHVPDAFPGRLSAAAIAITKMHVQVRTLQDTMVGSIDRALWVLLGAAAFLLLVACANVADLFLVRAAQKQHDLVVRRALGAGRGAIIVETLLEALLLSILGCVLGLALAKAGLLGLRSMESGIAIPRLDGVGVDGTVLAAAMGITVLIAFVMSVVPALHSYGADVASVLTQTARGATAGRSRHRVRRALVVVQVAVALVLVTGAGLMARSFALLRSVPPGFTPAHAYAFRAALPDAAYPSAAATVDLLTRALEKLAALPGVTAAGAVSKLPLDDESRRDTAVWIEDQPLAMGGMPNVHQVVYASPETFSALGIPFLQGHTFEHPDAARAPLEVIVTQALAKRYWGNEQVVGKRLRLSVPFGAWFTVVGVTGDVRGTRLDQPPDETVYLPIVTAPGAAAANGDAGSTRWTPDDWAFVVRSSASPHDVTVPVEQTLRALAPAVPIYNVRSMDDVLARSTARTFFTLKLLEIASLFTMLIGAVGLYGVVSYMVSLRGREMAVRMALGAQPAALRLQVMKEAMGVAALGIALGLGAAVMLTHFLTALLLNVAPTDTATLLGAIALMSAVAALASWVPARRAAVIDLASTLRQDV